MNEDQISEEKHKQAMAFAIDAIRRLPKGDQEASEAHIIHVLFLFIGALWQTMGTEYARAFLQAQLDDMQNEDKADQIVSPPIQ